MYTEKQIEALAREHFDWSRFDAARAAADEKQWTAASRAMVWEDSKTCAHHRLYGSDPCRGTVTDRWPCTPHRRRVPGLVPFPAGVSIRALHVTRSLYRGRPIVGERGIESPTTRDPMLAEQVQRIIDQYALPEADRAVA